MRDPAPAPGIAAATIWEHLRFFRRVVLPTWAKGILLRRQRVAAFATRWQLDDAALRAMQELRRKYGGAPVLFRAPRRTHLAVLSSEDLRRVLNLGPFPFSPATDQKRNALSHYEPQVSLISRGAERGPRRAFNDEILESRSTFHRLASNFTDILRVQASALLGNLRSREELTWPAFTEAWHATAREVVLGRAATTDRELTEQLAQLRATANWVYVPPRRKLRDRYRRRLSSHLERAEVGSLAGLIAACPERGGAAPLDQVTQWLFAFDAGGMTAFRALALLTTLPAQARQVADEVAAWRSGSFDLPYLRASFLDAVRLWPTTPVILRQSTEPTLWGGGTLPKGTNIIAYLPFFHRDDEMHANAHRFDPEQWLGKDPADNVPLVPFSAGPAACPGRHLVTLIGSAWLAALLAAGTYELIEPASLRADRELPVSLYPFSMRFRFAR